MRVTDWIACCGFTMHTTSASNMSKSPTGFSRRGAPRTIVADKAELVELRVYIYYDGTKTCQWRPLYAGVGGRVEMVRELEMVGVKQAKAGQRRAEVSWFRSFTLVVATSGVY